MSDDFLKQSWRDRLYYWYANKFRRMDCDGCRGVFPWDDVTPVGGDAYLCDTCFKSWYPEFCKESEP